MANISGNASFGSYSLTVTPEMLREKSNSVLTQIKKTRDIFDSITRIAQDTEGYWKGEAGEIHRDRFNWLKSYMEDILNSYTEHGNDLLTIGDTYSKAESEAVREIEALPVNPL